MQGSARPVDGDDDPVLRSARMELAEYFAGRRIRFTVPLRPAGTAFQTDIGMTGPYDSVIGVDKAIVLRRFLTALPIRMESARKGVELHAVIVEVNDSSGSAVDKAMKSNWLRRFFPSAPRKPHLYFPSGWRKRAFTLSASVTPRSRARRAICWKKASSCLRSMPRSKCTKSPLPSIRT